MRYCAFLIVAWLSLASSTRADGTWTLTTADFHTQSVTLKSLDHSGVRVTPAPIGDEKLIPFDQFLGIARPVVGAQAAGKFIAYLTSGDQIGGEPVSIHGNDLLWNSPLLGELPLPMKQLAAIARPGAPVPDSRQREDVVTLSNGDTLRGIIANLADAKVAVQTESGASEAPIGAIAQITFAAGGGGNSVANGFRVRFDEGSSVVAESVVVKSDQLELSLAKGAVHSVDLARVAAIEQVNGPVSWLSSRAPSQDLFVPFIGSPRAGAARMDRAWGGKDPIRFGAQQFAHGIGVHSFSRLSWNLDGAYEAFRTRYAIDAGEANTKADVTVRVLLDDKPVYEKTHVRAGTLSPVVVENLGGAKKLTLEVDYGDNMDTQDRLNWIEPALLKHKPIAVEEQ
ncbi:MAG TPA: NPCBM/NEW2 domain-containing protein [Tepidisphaeraceae bacterium]|jgi:hypothetical protein|nr:NPCBM/NEW2 domain-containing protein [Tepidisphaeraceae bacterium]